jgi:hypothetical protein
MKYNIIQTENYLLVGNDNNSKRGWFYCFRRKNLFQDEGEDILCCNGDMNIIAHLPLNNSPILKGVDLLPQIEQPKMPIGFECEIEKKEGKLMMIPPCKHCIKAKTITNSQGINQWGGKYIF